MGYKESDESASDAEPAADLPTELGELDFQEDDLELPEGEESTRNEPETAKKANPKGQVNARFSLKSRRAIEEHLERRRLRKELDYLFDEDATEGGEGEEKK
jgi:hypothetical protein